MKKAKREKQIKKAIKRESKKEQCLVWSKIFQAAAVKCPEFVTEIIRIVTGRIISYEQIETEKVFTNNVGKGGEGDAVVSLKGGDFIGVEVNTYWEGSSVERMSHYCFLEGCMLIKPNNPWKTQKKGTLIFFNEDDVFGHGDLITRCSFFNETRAEKMMVNSGLELLVVYLKAEAEGEIADLIHDLNANYLKEEMRLPICKKVVKLLLEKEMSKVMNKALYELYQKYGRENRAEGRIEGRAEGKAEGKAESVISMYNKGFDENAISYLLDIDLKTVRNIVRAV